MRTGITLGLIGLASAISISVKDQGSDITQCDPANKDCSCADKSYNDCIEPNPDVSVHTNNLDECILNCDLFHSFDQCEWLIFYNTGPDENCRLFGTGAETMERYLGSCDMAGQPLHYSTGGGTCMLDEGSPLCSGSFCPGSPPCTPCDNNDPCNVHYHEAQCTLESAGEVYESDDATYASCQSVCTLNSNANPYTYFNYVKSSEECFCVIGGGRSCRLQVVKYGFTVEEINNCKSGIVSGECSSDSDCAGDLLCDLNSVPECKTGCRQHSDCLDDDYCTCSDNPCPDPGMIGECMTGCRDLGDKCQVPAGGDGSCNNQHECTPEGTTKLNSIGLKTTSCIGCNSRAEEGAQDLEGARLKITLIQSPVTTCDTGVLDNPGVTDYNPADEEANFSEDVLGGCKRIDSYGADTVTVSWEGAGVWTPEIVHIYWTGPLVYNCKNSNNAEVSAASTITLPCSIGA